MLRKGAYGALMDEEDEGSKFCEEDIDQILQRRTHTITIQSEGKGSISKSLLHPLCSPLPFSPYLPAIKSYKSKNVSKLTSSLHPCQT